MYMMPGTIIYKRKGAGITQKPAPIFHMVKQPQQARQR